jgi:diguanylate cyclase (GGDEF)-like protein/PAS domain S-box-containing protein
MTNKITIVIFCLLFMVSVKAQERLWFDEITIEDGLSHSTILCMIQDKQGFIWIGTQFGLNRFDGYEFVIYKNEIADEKSISDNFIISIFEDSKGILWIGTNNGLNSFNKDTNQFTRYLHNPQDKTSLSNNHISSITEDYLGNIWVGTVGGGLNKYNRLTGRFDQPDFMTSTGDRINPLYVTDLMIDHQDKLWMTSGNARLRPSSEKGGIYVINVDSLELSKINPSIDQILINADNMTTVYQDDTKDIWFGTVGQGLLKRNTETEQFSQFMADEINDDNSITAITQDRTGRLWLATHNTGLYSLLNNGEDVHNYNSQTPEKSNLRDDDISDLLIDHTGIFWLGTWANAVKRVDFNSFQFQNYLQVATDYYPDEQDVFDINQDSKGNIWLATWESGLLKFNRETSKITRPKALDQATVGNVRHVFVDKHDKLWIGSNDKGVIYFDPDSNEVKTYQHDALDKYSLSNNKVIQIIDDPSGNLWIATRGGGVNYFNIAQQKFYAFRHDIHDIKTINDDKVSALMFDNQGYLWVGTFDALDIFDPITNKVIAHYKDGKKPQNLFGNSIQSLFLDSKERVWIGTEKGISQVVFPDSNQVTELTFLRNIGFKKSQLGSVGDFLEDNRGNIWISSIKFITRYNPETQAIKNFSAANGVLSGGYYIASSHKDETGKMYFGGLEGLTVFQADYKQYKSTDPKIMLTQLLLFNEPVFTNSNENTILTKNIENTDELKFNYKQNMFSLEFSAMHYSSPKHNQYAYKLEGFDDNWIYTDSKNRRATYTNLDAGEYNFVIKASNSQGEWSSPVHKLKIKVKAAPWKTTLAYFLYYLLAAILVGLFIWLRYKQMQAIKLRNAQLSLTSKLFENTSECVWLLDEEQRFLAINQGLSDVTGFSEKDLIGFKISTVEYKDQKESFMLDVLRIVQNGGRWEGEMWAQRKDGEHFPIEIVIDRVELQNSHDEIIGYQYVGVFSDITRRKKAEEELRFMAYFDKLTLLPNRTYFNLLVTESIENNQQNNSFIVFYLDLDNFKNVNDSLGHSYGDELLVTISTRLKEYSNDRYTIARLGGDEFALMVPQKHIDDSAQAFTARIAEEILIIIREKVVVNKHVLHVSASIGVTVYPNDGKDYGELLRNTDTAMYAAKKRGGNAFTLYSEDMNILARKRLMLEDELNKALVAKEIVPHYQPKVCLQTGKMEGLEILARWNHSKLGWIPPDQFIPVAEESKLINDISDQLLIQACHFLLPFIKSGKINGRISFNLSITQFINDDIVSRIDEILEACQFPTEYLEIEITESMVMGNVDKAIILMKQFTQRNIAISIDDFGTGYSSLSYLKKLPIDTLKIDISFIKDIVLSNKDQKIVKSIIYLAHSLGLKVVAEGGETLEQILLLKEMDCELLQGYYYSEALSAEQFKNLLLENKNLYGEKSE